MSKFLNRFTIPFLNLKEGIHKFDFEINDLFFDNFEFSEIKKGKLKADVTLEKQSSMLVLNFNITGFVIDECNICLEELKIDIENSYTLYVKFGEDFLEVTDDVITIPLSSNEINVSQFIYEFIHLSLPLKRVHPLNDKNESTCNPLMIQRINELAKKNSNNNTWDVLKNLNVN